MTLTSTLIAVKESGGFAPCPSAQDLRAATSIHALAFSSYGELLVVESEGYFTSEKWEEVYTRAWSICHGEEEEESGSDDVSMGSQGGASLENVLRDAVRQKVVNEHKWKQSPLITAT
jgi:exosome complex component RRP46